MAGLDHPIHDALVPYVDPVAGDVVVDLGCGRGGTLQAAERAAPDAAWVGVDRDAAALSAGGRVLAHGGRLIAAELSRPLPLADGTVDAVVCHNVLECLVDPVGLLDDAARMLRPGGRAVWSHTDFDALVIHAGEPELTRRVVYAYADTPQPWMDASDGQMGRKLAGLVRRSRLQLDRVHAHHLITTELEGNARARIDEIVAVLSPRAARGGGPVEGRELERWQNAVASAAEHGAFFYAETAFIAISHRPQ